MPGARRAIIRCETCVRSAVRIVVSIQEIGFRKGRKWTGGKFPACFLVSTDYLVKWFEMSQFLDENTKISRKQPCFEI